MIPTFQLAQSLVPELLSQGPTTVSCPEPVQSISLFHTLFRKETF